ncbi:MAG: Flp pilus assembly protein CpaB [Gammaproteobacteria bacterium]
MNSRFFIMLIIALMLAAGAALLAKRWVESQTGEKPVTAEQNTVLVYVAATNIPFATRVDKTQIKLTPWPKDMVPSEAFTEEDTKKDPDAVVGKVAQREFYTDEILLKPQLKEHGVGSNLSALIEEGMRAMSVRVDDVAGVAGFILPGNRADIIATGKRINCQPQPRHFITSKSADAASESGTYTLLPNVKILAIDQLASQEQDKPAVVRALTLEVTPKQAECLVQAMRTGPLQFTLRNSMDTEPYIEPPVESQPVSTPVPNEKPTRNKAPVSVKILPWGSQTFKQCEEGGAC